MTALFLTSSSSYKLVCGLWCGRSGYSKELVAESNLTLEKATNIAVAMNTTVCNIETLESPMNKGRDPVLAKLNLS